MKNAKLIINEKEINIEISDQLYEELAHIPTANKRTTGYERASSGSCYYTDSCGKVEAIEECKNWTEDSEFGITSKFDEEVYKSGNYYSDPDVAANNIRADNLMRQLRRFAVENRKTDIDWADENQDKHYLYYDYVNKEFFINSTSYWRTFGQIYFDTKEMAELAVEIFKDELLWYFTEYRDSL